MPPPKQMPRGLEGDLEFLRTPAGDWAPQLILKRFGYASAPQDQLPRVMAAVAVLLGPFRMFEVVRRLESELPRMIPALRMLIGNDALAAKQHDLLKRLGERIPGAMGELRMVKRHAVNDAQEQFEGGLRGSDLAYFVLGLRTFILTYEITRRKTRVGVEEAVRFAVSPPSLAYAKEWAKRLFGYVDFDGFLLFYPEEYGRLILVYEDGRLAYDPIEPTTLEAPEKDAAEEQDEYDDSEDDDYE